MAAYNDKPCDTCEHFDPVMRGQTAKGGLKETRWGWCALRSAYPAKEGPGQKFPANVQRVAVGELAKPFIVAKGHVQSNCKEHTVKSTRLSKADLLKQLQDKEGRVQGM
jgi:hypothetical protein